LNQEIKIIDPEIARQLMEANFVSQPKSISTWSPDVEDLLLGIAKLGWDINLIITKESCHITVTKKDNCFVKAGQKEEITNLVGQMFLNLKDLTKK